MRIALLAAAAVPATLFFFATHSAQAQTPDSAATRATAGSSAGSGTLLRLGTGVTRGFEIGGYPGLKLPLVLGAEHHLTPAVSIYGNAFASLETGRRNRFADGRRLSRLGDYGFDIGVKYYYNQEKRRQKGRATGPFVGNYFSIQSNTTFNPDTYQPYRYSTFTVQWGMQRRLGKHGWFEAYAGAGISRVPGYSYTSVYYTTYPNGNPVYTRQRQPVILGIAPEIGVKFSLGKVVK
jgi:hypothetical protein